MKWEEKEHTFSESRDDIPSGLNHFLLRGWQVKGAPCLPSREWDDTVY